MGAESSAESYRGEVSRDLTDRSPPPAAEPELNRWGELCDPAMEQEFRADRFQRELKSPLRWSAWSVTLIYLAFGPIDWLIVRDAVWLAWPIRYGFAVPVSLALAVVTLTRHAGKYHRTIGIIHTLIGPALFLTVGVSAGDPGGVLYVAWGAVLFPLRAAWSKDGSQGPRRSRASQAKGNQNQDTEAPLRIRVVSAAATARLIL